MSAHVLPKLLTVEEYEQIPDPPGGRYELRHGELALVTWPVWQHAELQRRLRRSLEPMADLHGFVVNTEFAYRPLPENEVWGADVACISGSRYRVKKWLMGSPELVIEVKSPSNTKTELHDKAMTTLAGAGSTEFWVVDAKTCTVTVYSASGMRVYGRDAAVPVPIFPGQIDLNELFDGLDDAA